MFLPYFLVPGVMYHENGIWLFTFFRTVDELGLDKSIVSGEFILFLGPFQPFGMSSLKFDMVLY